MITRAVVLQWIAWGLLPSAVPAAPTHNQVVLQPAPSSTKQPLRKLQGRFLHITDLHPDPFYKVHSSTEETIACHRGNGPAGTYGAETSDCDSPFSLVNATLDWVTKNIRDDIDFVIWTGDSARHDSDEETPRHNKEILETNRQIADSFSAAFSDEHGLTIPIVPTFGNNDIYPHNILMPGPNDVLRSYTDIWRDFIPEAQRHSFEFGGWFYVEVIPGKLAVFSLNTMYFFDRNAGIDDCAKPSEPGYKHFDWLRIQLQFLRNRGMKAILMGHVPPARTASKQLWDETCWQKYTLWLKQYRDVVVGSVYGHMNIDHFLLQDSKDLDFSLREAGGGKLSSRREPLEDDMSINSGADYLIDLRNLWAQLPKPAALKASVDTQGKKKKKHKKNKLGGPWAERYQLSLVSPSIVPNYFPSIRVIEYNITGLENAATWVDHMRGQNADSSLTAADDAEVAVLGEQLQEVLELRELSDGTVDVEGKKKKKKKKPKQPSFVVPEPPSKSAGPGPAYSPQPLTFTGFTQYYANLTRINNDIAPSDHDEVREDEADIDLSRWNPGKHHGKKPKHDKPSPNEFAYEVEYDTFNDKIYKLKDLTVRSFVELAHTIGQASAKAKAGARGMDDEDDDYEEDSEGDDSDFDYDEDEAEDDEDDEDEDGAGEEEDEEDEDGQVESNTAGKKGKKGKGKKGKKKKARKVWLHFAKHAFVSTRSVKELKGIDK